jgi:hypothetical protein
MTIKKAHGASESPRKGNENTTILVNAIRFNNLYSIY